MSTVKIEMRGGIDVLPRYASGCRLKIQRKKEIIEKQTERSRSDC